MDTLGGIQDCPLLTVAIDDPETGLNGWVCIHSMGRHGASGGMRCLPDVTRDEVESLARAMSYKYSFFMLQQGGAKAGLRIPYEADGECRKRLIQEAARHLESLIKTNIWSPWTDMNFFRPDLAVFYNAIGINFPVGSGGGSSYRTALSAFASLDATLSHAELDPARATVALEGFGSVASYLAPMLQRRRIRVVAASTHRGGVYREEGLDLSEVLEAQRQYGNAWVERSGRWESFAAERVFGAPCDVLMPGARVHSIESTRAAAIQAKYIVPIANVPCTDDALTVLDTRRVVYVPDYVVNGGGVCGPALIGARPDRPDSAAPFLERFGAMVRRLLRVADLRGVPPRVVSDEVAHRNYRATARPVPESPSLSRRFLTALRDMHIVPAGLADLETKRRASDLAHYLETLFLDAVA